MMLKIDPDSDVWKAQKASKVSYDAENRKGSSILLQEQMFCWYCLAGFE